MRTVAVEGDQRAMVMLDVCPSCQMAWMASDQIPALPRQPRNEAGLNARARELVAMAEVEAMRENTRREQAWSPPDAWWRTVLTLFGFPVEENAPPLLRRPWVTWSLVAGMLAMALWGWASGDAEAIMQNWGLAPNDPFRHGGLNWITSFFLHGGILHLLGNVYFLLIFGDNVEDLLGPARYAALLAVAAVVAGATHLLLAAPPALPLVGASGAISGVLMFYALALPRVRLVFFVWGFGWLSWIMIQAGRGWFRLSARWALAAWVVLQAVGIWQQVAGFSNISALAHVGGALAGGVGWWFWRGSLIPTLEPRR